MRSEHAGWLALVRLVLVLVASAWLLHLMAGPPRLPDGLPGPETLATTLQGSSIPLEALGYALTSLAWLVWAWLCLSLVVQLALGLAELATHGADWVHSLRDAADRLTLPLVRHAVDSALAVAVVVQVVAHAPVASAAPLPPDPPAAAPLVTESTAANLVETPAPTPMPAHAEYTVVKGDTLWDISGRSLGDPTRWPEIYELNQGQASMPDGRTLTNPNLIWPNLELELPVEVDAEADTEAAAVAEPAPVAEAPPAPVEPTSVDSASQLIADSGQIERAPADLFAGAAAGGLGVIAVSSLGVIAIRRRRGLSEPPLGDEPESDIGVRGGFADLDWLSRRLAAGAALEPVDQLAAETLRFFDDRGFQGRVGIVSARAGKSSTTLALVSQRLADRPRLLESVPALSQKLGIWTRAQASRDHDVLLRCAGRGPLAASVDARSARSQLLPIGLLADRRVLLANWPALGHVLVGGRSRPAAGTVLTSLAVGLATRFSPAELQLLTIGNASRLPRALSSLPHHMGALVDPADSLATSTALHDLRAELVRRMQHLEHGNTLGTLSEIVLLVPDLEQLGEHRSTLEMLGAYGPSHRIRMLATSAAPETLPDGLLGHFTSRLVLRPRDEADSERLLGSSSAMELLGGGQMLVRIDQREPLEVYAFRVPEPELQRISQVLRGEPLDLRQPTRTVPEPVEDAEFEDDACAVPAASEVVRPLRTPTESAPSIDVRCFGGFDVVAHGRDLTLAASPAQAGEQSAAWELLAFLGVQPEGIVPEGDVLAALWPREDPHVAHGLLVERVERLRALLHASLPQFAGGPSTPAVWLDEREMACRLDLSRVESDVHRFSRLCRAAALMSDDQAAQTWERARELYRGDLLDGPGAREYPWAVQAAEDGQLSPRDHYREQYYRATLRLARGFLREDRPDAALPLFQMLLEAEPLLEDVVRDAFRCHAALGDVRGLEAEHERLLAALRLQGGPQDDDPDPEPATAGLFAELHHDLELRATLPA
jgi:DNA-binding SARP family transcriptional activator